MKPDILWNFISPVTGRILADPNYVLMGNRLGMATPSPILIDIRLDLIDLQRTVNSAFTADFIVGHPNPEVPNAQALSNLANGIMLNTAGIVSTITKIPIDNMPDLSTNNIWIGNSMNRPVANPTIALGNMPTINQGSVYIGNASNRPVIGNPPRGPEGPQGPQGERGPSGSNGFGIGGLAGLAGVAGVAGAAGAAGTAGSTGKGGAGGAAGAAGAAGVSTLLIITNYNMSGNRISNLAQSPQEDYDAITAKWVWDLVQDNIIINF